MDVSTSRVRARARTLTVALGASSLLNLGLLGFVLWPEDEAPPTSQELAAAAEAAQPSAAIEEPSSPAQVEAEQLAEAEVDSSPAPSDGVQVTLAKVKGSIPQTLAEAAAPHGDTVSATLSRLLVWDLDLRRDLRAGDSIEVAWRLDDTDQAVIEAARFHAQKYGKTITGYRFQASGDEVPSYWSADGVEVPHRLKRSPLERYEQITSLLKDRPTHHGMDFKVEVGTPVVSGYDGVVTRTNWNWKANGNCIEIRHDDGTLAKYLHLSDNEVKPGDRVRAGAVIGLTGNTGRSTGPHLHYQLNRGTKVVDPIDYHGTVRRTLPEADRAAFDEVVKRADARFDVAGGHAAR